MARIGDFQQHCPGCRCFERSIVVGGYPSILACPYCGDRRNHPAEAPDICPTYEKFYDDAVEARIAEREGRAK